MIENLGTRPEWKTAEIGSVQHIGTRQLHLWWLPLTLNSSQRLAAENLLSDLQRDKYTRRATPALQHAYLAGRYYLLYLLSAYAGCQPHQIKLSYSRLNKPSLSDGDQNIEFNFTDTTIDGVTHGLFAFTKSLAVGVDLEARARRSNYALIVEKRFTENEKEYVTKANSNQIDPDRFLSIWTRKEAFGKAKGVGINFKMNEHDLASDNPKLNFFDQDDQAWGLLQLDLGEQLIASVVHAEHQTLSLQAYQLPLGESKD